MDELYIWVIIVPIIVIFILMVIVAVKIVITHNKRTKLAKESAPNEINVELQNQFLDSFGGRANIIEVTHEMSRITVRVNDLSLANLEQLKTLGATGVLVMGNEIKCAFGDKAKEIFELIK